MARRERLTSFKCAEPGCNEWASYAYRTEKEYREIHARQVEQPYECSRHRDRHEVLHPDNTDRVHVLVARKIPKTRGDGYLPGLFWLPEGAERGGSGLSYGPGFRAHASDVPEGTRLIVTARLELPTPDVPQETTPDA